MPIISEIGRRSLKVRILYSLIYLVLTLGAVTMVYPLMLMLSGSIKSDADSWAITPYPEFWFQDRVLFQKYVESKYNGNIKTLQGVWCTPAYNWRSIEKPSPVAPEWIEAFREWRRTVPPSHCGAGHTRGPGLVPKNLRDYRKFMAAHYKGNLEAYNREANQMFASWNDTFPPGENIGRGPNRSLTPAFREVLSRWKASLPPEDRIVGGVGSSFAMNYLVPRYTGDIQAYNGAHGTTFASFVDIPFPSTVPPKAGLPREEWESFVRKDLMLELIRLDKSLQPAFRAFLEKHIGSLEQFNHQHGTPFKSLDDIPFPARIADAPFFSREMAAFLSDPRACPIEAVRLVTPEDLFREFLAGRPGGIPADIPPLPVIIAATDWADCMAHKAAHRWEFTTRNYIQVITYISLHGNGFLNTLIYCMLAIGTALLINPMAAYALSRFKLPGTYKILLFLMATMAFPGEVTMIPGFILLKRFPLWPILTVVGVTIGLFLILEKTAPRVKENWRALGSLACGLVAGAIIVPHLFPDKTTISLLNTFSALILPHLANGYFIFLLKGFFDSMPKELYEAAEIDGASEWTKFWVLTMNISKPILSVIALGAFTHAYSAFMMALIIIPDQRMWTIMVWIYQLQSHAHGAVVYASLVLAAIPTFLIFTFCQNLIIRGIVVPTEK